MLRLDLSSILLGISVVMFAISTFSTISAQLNFTRFTLPRKGYRNMNLSRRSSGNTSNVWLFKDYIKQFNPTVVFNKIYERKRAKGQIASAEGDFHEIYEGIDATDDLLRLNVESVSSGRRKWIPLGHPDTEAPSEKDLFSLRQRLFELMRQIVYRTRNKLVIMQLLRTKYRNSTLYKMGFLMSRVDTACKSFAAYTYRSIHACVSKYYAYSHGRHELISLLTAEERMTNKWFEIELLIDLIMKNDELAKETIAKNEKGRKIKWKFID